MVSITEIYEFISEAAGVEIYRLNENTDIFEDLGVDGDDFFELMEDFAEKYGVDLSDYLWYFHHGTEGFSFVGAMFRVYPQRIAVTPRILLECANTKKWPIQYPKHTPSESPPVIAYLLDIPGIVTLFGSIFR